MTQNQDGDNSPKKEEMKDIDLDEQDLKKLKELLARWDEGLDDEEQKLYAEMQAEVEPSLQAVAESERLTAEDYAIRINVRQ